VFRGLGDDFEVVIDPAFNEDASLYNQHYKGTITDWELLTGSVDAPKRISLSKDEPVRIIAGSCEREDDVDEEDEKEREDEKETEGEEDENRGKYTICHKPSGNPDNARTIRVGTESALRAHLEHGDIRGPCSGDE
jgi:hypothetical protein